MGIHGGKLKIGLGLLPNAASSPPHEGNSSPMPRRLPPFPALFAFEAAARHLSFRRAAEELCLTQSAISHRVRQLETFLGATLFERTPRGVRLSAAGRRYQAGLGQLLDRIEEATARVSGEAATGRLTIQSTPGCAAHWLVPRLHRFHRQHPGIETAIISAIDHPIDFSHGDADVILQFGADRIPGVLSEPFLSSTRAPVASPALLAQGPPVRGPRDLLQYPLLHDMVGDGWAEWFARAGLPDAPCQPGPRFAHCDLVMSAALAGQGIALCWTAFCEDAVAAGRLVRLSPIGNPERIIYSVATLESRSRLPKIAAFRAWIGQEAALAEGAAARSA